MTEKKQEQPWHAAARRGAYHAAVIFGLSALLHFQFTSDLSDAAVVGGITSLMMLASRAGIEGWVDQRRVKA